MDGWVDYFSGYLYGLKVITAGLIILIFINGIDDLFIDTVYWFRRLWLTCTASRHRTHISDRALYQLQEKPLAIMVPSRFEAGAPGKMASLLGGTLDYENYHIFVSAFPNDPATECDIDEVCARFPNVHKVVCAGPGPASKADCLNTLLNAILQFERDACFSFSGVILHEAEDRISPLELRLFNYLIDRNDLIQLPVYPLERSWKHFTSLSYGDELSEYYGKELPVREALAGQVSGFGAGTCFSRRALLTLLSDGDGIAFNAQNFAEDYDLGLRLHQKGMRETFCRYTVGDFSRRQSAARWVCVREYFPDTFGAAVRKKSRWIIGVVYQSFKNRRRSASWAVNYFLWRDIKGGLVNIVAFTALLIALQLGSLWVYQHAVEDAWQFLPLFYCASWLSVLLWLDLCLLLNRIAQRVIFACGYYGFCQGMMCVPRLLWSSLINFTANCRAMRWGVQQDDAGRVVADEMGRDFQRKTTCSPYFRPLGEILLARNMISQAQLEEAVQHRITGVRLGGSLVRSGIINTLQLAEALAEQAGVPMERIDCRCLDKRLVQAVPAGVARHYAVLPLREEPAALVFASESPIDPVSLAALARKVGRRVRYVVVPLGEVVVGLRRWYGETQKYQQHALLSSAAAAGLLRPQQAEALWGEYVSGQILFAEILVAENYLHKTVLNAALLRYEHTEMLFGEFLVQEQVVDQPAIDHALAQQQKLQPSLSWLMQKAGLSRLQISSLAGEIA